jgi:predicted DNA-binding protein
MDESVDHSTMPATVANVPKQRRRIGRPPAGAHDGERVTDYPQLSIRLPAEIKAKLHAISVISSRPQWRLITDAIECYLRTRPEEEQRLVDELLARTRSRSGKGRRGEG